MVARSGRLSKAPCARIAAADRHHYNGPTYKPLTKRGRLRCLPRSLPAASHIKVWCHFTDLFAPW